jgi:hypothetical protein
MCIQYSSEVYEIFFSLRKGVYDLTQLSLSTV